ncbi:MAG: thioredoxin family protein [Candidatus Odinarchaeota archaeon]
MNSKKVKFVVYGKGCAKCEKLEDNVRKAIEMMDLEKDSYSLKKIKDPAEITESGVFMTPALSINGEMVFHGRVGTKKSIVEHVKKII